MLTPRDNYSLGCAGLVAGTTSTISIGNAMAFGIAGRTFQKAAAANVVPALRTGATAAVALTLNQACVFWWWLDTAGALTYSQSDVRNSATHAQYVPGAFGMPGEEAGYTLIGAVKITTNASGAFTIGTTAMGAANTTATFYNFGLDYGVPITF